MKYYTPYVLLLISVLSMNAQQAEEPQLPYKTIPPYPEHYTPGTVVARMIDGLGFRYFWATQGLNENDLAYRPVADSRSIMELILHVHGLSETILNAALKQSNDRRKEKAPPGEVAELRAKTLENFKLASQLMARSKDLHEHPLTFISENGRRDYPFWHLINGPVEDAVWHCGQIVMLRRANGNPLPQGVNVFTGKTKN